MSTSKDRWYYAFIIVSLLIVISLCIQFTSAYFTDTAKIGSKFVNVPYATKTVKNNNNEITNNDDVYEITSVVGDNSVTLTINTNYPVVVRFDHTELENIDITYDTKFSLADDGYYYYNDLVTSSTINLFSFTATQTEELGLVVDVVQANYYGLGAMIGYVKDFTGEQSIEYSTIDFVNKTFTYNVSKADVGGKIIVVGYGKTLEEVTSSKTITITAYTNITFKVVINFTA